MCCHINCGMSLHRMPMFTLMQVQAVFFLIHFTCISVSLFIPIYFLLSALSKLLLPINEMPWRAGHIYTTLAGTRDFAAYTKPQPPVVVRLVRAKQDIFYVLLVHHKSLHEVILLFHDFSECKSLYYMQKSDQIHLEAFWKFKHMIILITVLLRSCCLTPLCPLSFFGV